MSPQAGSLPQSLESRATDFESGHALTRGLHTEAARQCDTAGSATQIPNRAGQLLPLISYLQIQKEITRQYTLSAFCFHVCMNI